MSVVYVGDFTKIHINYIVVLMFTLFGFFIIISNEIIALGNKKI